MSELKINGKIKMIGEIQQFDSGFKKIEFVVTTLENFPQDIKFEITQNKVDDFVKYNKIGKDVEVSFNIRGNEYNGKYYVSLQAWKVFGMDKATTAPTAPTAPVEDEEDLPF